MNDIITCRSCGAENSLVTDFTQGEIVCDNCGLVLEERIIDDTYEKRNFGSENGGNKGESRVGGPLKASEGNNLGTNMVLNDKNGNMKKMRGLNNPYCQSPLDRGFEEIDKLLSNMGVAKSVIEDTKEIFDQVTKMKKMKGRNLKCMILAMYYCASKNCGVSLSFKEIASRFNYEEKKIKKAFNYIKSAIGYSNLSPEKLNESVISFIRDFIPAESEVYNFKQLAFAIAKNINDSCLLEGRNPNTIAALSLIIAVKLYKKKDMTNEVNRTTLKKFCSENTLDNAFEKVKDYLDRIIPKEYYTQNMTLSIK